MERLNIFRTSLFALGALAALVTSCQKVSELSDTAMIEQVKVVATTPERVIIGEPLIKSAEIELPLIYGKYIFPITVSLDVKGDCERILGFDEGNSLTFDNLAHIREIYTVAPSGTTIKWQIKLSDAASSESAQVYGVKTSSDKLSEGTIMTPQAAINQIEGIICINTVGTAPVFPFTVKCDYALADGAKLVSDAASEITFEKADTTTFVVEAASGKVKTWRITTDHTLDSDNSDVSKLTADQVERLTLDAKNITLSSDKISLEECTSKFSGGSRKPALLNLNIAAKSGEVTFPLSLKIDIAPNESTQLIGVPTNNVFVFESYATTHSIYVTDNLSGLTKCWSLGIFPPEKAELLSIDVTRFTSTMSGVQMVGEPSIDPATNTVIFTVARDDNAPIDPTTKISARFDYTTTLSEGATTTTKYSSFTYVTTVSSLNVKSPTGNMTRYWYLYVKDRNAVKSSEKSILNLSVSAYSSKEDGVVLKSSSFIADNTNKKIEIEISAGARFFPLSIDQKSFRFKDGGAHILEPEVGESEKPLVFATTATVHTFTVEAEDGSRDEWTMSIKNSAPVEGSTADIISFSSNRLSQGSIPSEVDIDRTANTITMTVETEFPLFLEPVFVLSDNATVSKFDNNTIRFDSFATVIPFTVTAQDGSKQEEWSLHIVKADKVQLANSDFELWGEYKNINGGTYTIDPTPGLGFGWGSANLMLMGIGVKGTMPIDHNGGKAVELTTAEQNTIFKGYVVAAGTLYTGIFNLNLDYITSPRKMTKFGIPYTARPESFSFDVRYVAGGQLKEARANDKGSFAIYDIEGVDKGHIWVELLEWQGDGAIDYDGNPGEKVKVIGRAELIIDGSNNPYKDWARVTIPVIYNTSDRPTHIAIVASSSKDGDKFIGAYGSKLGVDNFHINY